LCWILNYNHMQWSTVGYHNLKLFGLTIEATVMTMKDVFSPASWELSVLKFPDVSFYVDFESTWFYGVTVMCNTYFICRTFLREDFTSVTCLLSYLSPSSARKVSTSFRWENQYLASVFFIRFLRLNCKIFINGDRRTC
jgi:hypothetical protein